MINFVELVKPINGQEIPTSNQNIQIQFQGEVFPAPKDFSYIIYLSDGKKQEILKQVKVDVKKYLFFNNSFSFTDAVNIKKSSGQYQIKVSVIADKSVKTTNIAYITIVQQASASKIVLDSSIVFSAPQNNQEFLLNENLIDVSFTAKLDKIPKLLFYSIYLIDGIKQQTLTTRQLDPAKDILLGPVISAKETFFIKKDPGQYQIKVSVSEDSTIKQNIVNFKFVETKIEPLIAQQEEEKEPIVPEGFFDPQPDNQAAKLEIFGEILKPHNLQVFDDAFFQIDANGIPKNYIPISAEIKITDKPKKASYKIILRDVFNSIEAPIDGGDLIPFLTDSKKQFLNFKTPQEATIDVLLPLFVNGQYKVFIYFEADNIKGFSHTKSFSVNITKKVIFPETTPEQETEPPPPAPEQILPPPPPTPFKPVKFPPELLPIIKGTEGIGTISFPEITPISQNYISAPTLKTHLYQKEKNKVLFEIDKFFLISNNYDSQIKKLQESKQYKLISEIVKEKFLNNIYADIYVSEEKPQNLSDIVNNSNLFKKLDVFKGELYFQKYLDVNKDYYFIIEAKRRTNLETKINYSQIQKIKVIKDEDLYFIQNEVVAEVIKEEFFDIYILKYYDFIDKEKIKTFLGKTFIESKFVFSGFNLNGPSKGLAYNNKDIIMLSGEKFNSSQNTAKYIKLRVASKKTNRKIDINLNYSFLPNLQPIKDIAEINGKKNKKLNQLVYFSIPSNAPGDKKENFNNFILELMLFLDQNTNKYQKIQLVEKAATIQEYLTYSFSFQNDMQALETFISDFFIYVQNLNSPMLTVDMVKSIVAKYPKGNSGIKLS